MGILGASLHEINLILPTASLSHAGAAGVVGRLLHEVGFTYTSSVHRRWRLLSTHALILVIVDARPQITMREIAQGIGVSERQVAATIAELRANRLLDVVKRGRLNVYRVRRSARLPQPLPRLRSVGQFLDFVRPIAASALELENPTRQDSRN